MDATLIEALSKFGTVGLVLAMWYLGNKSAQDFKAVIKDQVETIKQLDADRKQLLRIALREAVLIDRATKVLQQVEKRLRVQKTGP